MTWRAHIDIGDYGQHWRILLGRKNQDGSYDVLTKPDLVHVPPDEMVTPAFMEMSSGEAKAFLQTIVDAAWEVGVRPSDHARHSGAQEKHLADMRRLVSKLAKVELP